MDVQEVIFPNGKIMKSVLISPPGRHSAAFYLPCSFTLLKESVNSCGRLYVDLYMSKHTRVAHTYKNTHRHTQYTPLWF